MKSHMLMFSSSLSRLVEPKDGETAGALMTFFSGSGFVAGSSVVVSSAFSGLTLALSLESSALRASAVGLQ